MDLEVRSVSDDLLDELDATVVMLGRMFTARHGEGCEPQSLAGPRLIALRILSEAGPVKAGDLAALLGIKAPATSSLIDSLERDGFVTREHAADDRRVTFVHLTDAGRTGLQEAEVHRREHMRRYMSVLSDEDIRTLIRIHRTLIESMVSRDI